MTGKSNYLEDKVLNWALKAIAMGTAPTTVYVGLHVGDPTDAGTGGTEVTATIRAAGRVAATFGSITTASGANTISNTAEVDFGDADGSVTGVSHFSLWDNPTPGSGNMLYSNALTGGAQDISAGTQVSFAIGDLDLSED